MIRRIAVVVIAIAAVAASAALVVSLVIFQTTPPSLAAAERITDAPVQTQEYADERAVSLTVRPAPDVEIRTSAEGLLTRSDCAEGGTLVSGASTFRVDGVPLVNLHLRVPLWRDLVPGDSGDDVDSLKDELRQLGLDISSGPTLRWAEIDAIRELYERAGITRDSKSIEKNLIVWIPLATTTVSECRSQLAAPVSAESVLAISRGVSQISLTTLPAGLLPGVRHLTVDGASVPLTESMTMDPSADVASLLNTPSYRTAAEKVLGKEPVTLTGSIALNDAVQVVPLPPASIALSSGNIGCVRSGEATFAVQIVGSQLGRSIVVFDAVELPSSISLDPPAKCA